jgi:hypothetical protein
MHVHVVDARAIAMSRPAPAQESDVMAAPRESAEDLVQMNLGASSLWIFDVLPIHEEELH